MLNYNLFESIESSLVWKVFFKVDWAFNFIMACFILLRLWPLMLPQLLQVAIRMTTIIIFLFIETKWMLFAVWQHCLSSIWRLHCISWAGSWVECKCVYTALQWQNGIETGIFGEIYCLYLAVSATISPIGLMWVLCRPGSIQWTVFIPGNIVLCWCYLLFI